MTQPNQPALFRLRVRYVKRGRLSYLGHLEVIHTVERIVRRAGLPYAVTQGFSPHMRVGYTSALPVGTSSACEWYDVFLTELVPPADALERLRAASPEDLAPDALAYIDVRTPALTAQITRVSYLVRLHPVEGERVDPATVSSALAVVRAAGSIEYLRGKKAKRLDLVKTLVGFETRAGADGTCELLLDTRCDNDGALRPEILLAALDREIRGAGADDEGPIVSSGIQDLRAFSRAEVARAAQCIEGEDGSLTDPLGAPCALALGNI